MLTSFGPANCIMTKDQCLLDEILSLEESQKKYKEIRAKCSGCTTETLNEV
jgi:hypothetical protein